MKVTIIGRASGHQHVHANALEKGLRARGFEVSRRYTSAPSPGFVACWGWRIGQAYRDAGAEVLVMERGYLGDRFSWTSIAWNGLNGRGTFPTAPDDGGERFRTHHGQLMQPWRAGGECALLIGQVPGDASLQGKNLEPWYADTARLATRRFGLPVVFRPHPLAHRRGSVRHVPGTTMREGPLTEELQRASVVITYNSNTAVESVLAGVPTIAMDAGSMAWDMASHSVNANLIMPDRERWAADLAWKQWTLAEIESGAALENVFSQARRVA